MLKPISTRFASDRLESYTLFRNIHIEATEVHVCHICFHMNHQSPAALLSLPPDLRDMG